MLWSFVFIRNRRFAYIICFAFFHEEYLIAPVDFIVALRRTKGRGRRTLRSPPSPSSGLHLIHPGNPLRRGILAAAVYANIGFLYPVLSLLPSSEYSLGVLCSGLDCSRFSRFRWALIARFSLLVGWTVRSCGYVMFCYSLLLNYR